MPTIISECPHCFPYGESVSVVSTQRPHGIGGGPAEMTVHLECRRCNHRGPSVSGSPILAVLEDSATRAWNSVSHQELMGRFICVEKDLQGKVDRLEKLRPHWAKGYTDDSIAAQTYLVALNEVYDALGVKTQTDCMKAIHKLKEKKA